MKIVCFLIFNVTTCNGKYIIGFFAMFAFGIVVYERIIFIYYSPETIHFLLIDTL